MKISYLFKVLSVFCIILGQNVLGQNQNPSVSSAVRFEEYPVDLSTGLPQVTIPIYSMPTRSNDISINMLLSYHPSTSVLADMKRSGNCGTGWNLSGGGAVSQTSINSSIYNFNFMGFSGKLNAFRSDVKITENTGEKIVVTTQLNSAGTEIIAFNFYDDKGYRYHFSDFDVIQIRGSNGGLTSYKTSFQLTSIYDNNNNVLANFTYNTYEHPIYIQPTLLSHHNYYKFLTEINSPGHGKIELVNSYFDTDGLWILCTGAKIKDVNGATVRNFDFQHDFDEVVGGAEYKLKNIKLKQVIESATGGVDPQIHKFFYRTVQTVENTIEGADLWGYFNNIYKWCDDETVNWMTDKTRVIEGVLEKMILPTGGCIVYQYESNTYSYGSGVRLDVSNNVVNEQFYNNIEIADNRDNFRFTTIASSSNLTTSTPLSFTLTEPTQLYFKIDAEQYGYVPIPGSSIIWKYPIFTLKNNPGTSAFTKTFTKLGTSPYYQDKNFSNQENNCLGYTRLFPAGTYTFSINESTGSVQIYKAALITTPSKFWYGGGIRIKTIGYFKEDNIPQNYFDSFSFILPSRTITYKYNIFENPALSSGSTGSGTAIKYKNVTVIDSKLRGRTEYTFLSPIDFVNNLSSASNFQIGKLKNKKVFNDVGVLQLESSYEYNAIPSIIQENEGTEFSSFAMGWMVPYQILNKEYFPEGTVETKDVLTYDDINRKVKTKTTTTSRSSESLITKYYYHVGNSIYSQNRIGELDYVEEFLGTNLLSTTKFEYSNVWKNNAGATINVAHLPQQIKSSKGSGALEIRSKINRYDQFGHVLETEQPNGIKKSFIWGYNSTVIIAEIDNMAYADIPETLITAVQTQSLNVGQPNLFIGALLSLRNAPQLADAFITTYTYKPLVGALTITDPRGYETRYSYDTSNRLIEVRDHSGNIITKNTYNTKPQN